MERTVLYSAHTLSYTHSTPYNAQCVAERERGKKRRKGTLPPPPSFFPLFPVPDLAPLLPLPLLFLWRVCGGRFGKGGGALVSPLGGKGWGGAEEGGFMAESKEREKGKRSRKRKRNFPLFPLPRKDEYSMTVSV